MANPNANPNSRSDEIRMGGKAFDIRVEEYDERVEIYYSAEAENGNSTEALLKALEKKYSGDKPVQVFARNSL